MKHFAGSKGGAGIAQWIINQMPIHRVYVEMFLGRGVILDKKKPAMLNAGIECDPETLADYKRRRAKLKTSLVDRLLIEGDALKIVPEFRVESDWLIYADPPYLGSSRSCKRSYYRHEMFDEAAHDRLLSVLTGLQCMVMVSGYHSELYSRRLADWRTTSFWTVNRRGKRVQEFLWMNFPATARLHDPRWIGEDCTKRQGVHRKVERWKEKFLGNTPAERQAILAALLSVPAEPVENDSTGSPSQNPLEDPEQLTFA